MDHDQLVASNIKEEEVKNSTSLPEPMSDQQWYNASPEEMAEHISIEGPKTEYEKETNTFRKNADRLQNFWLDRIDSMDPNLGQDVTSAFMDTEKTTARIKMLERKVEEESHGFENVEQYESDKLILENLKK